MTVDLSSLSSDLSAENILFSETGGFVLSVGAPHATALRTLAQKQELSLFEIGKTTATPLLDIKDAASFDMPILHDIWKNVLSGILDI